MKVKDVCTREVRSCRRSTTLAEAAAIFHAVRCSAVPVVEDDGRLAGILTERDVCLAGAANAVPLCVLKAGDAMTSHPRTCRLEQELLLAMEEMGRHRVRRLPVVDSEGRLQGILSLGDIVHAARSPAVAQPGQPTFGDLAQLLRSLHAFRRRRGERRKTRLDPFMA